MSENVMAWYWTIALIVFAYWSILFYLDHSTSKSDLISWIVLLVAPLFWPIVLPISSWELSRKALKGVLI